MLSVGELNENKNHKTVVKAMAKLDNKNVYYAVAGKGDLHDELLSLASDLGLNKRFKLLGFRSDVDELYKIADCFVHPSFREGLPVSIMEAMASGLPVLCSAIRGNVDLIDVNGGWLFDSQKEDECQRALSEAICCDLKAMGQYNLEKAKQFESGNIISIMREIYGRGSH